MACMALPIAGSPMSNLVAQKGLALVFDRSVATGDLEPPRRVLRFALPDVCLGGAEVVRRMAPRQSQKIP
jgi:hypothetical protein